jgi:hypothetical protein
MGTTKNTTVVKNLSSRLFNLRKANLALAKQLKRSLGELAAARREIMALRKDRTRLTAETKRANAKALRAAAVASRVPRSALARTAPAGRSARQ